MDEIVKFVTDAIAQPVSARLVVDTMLCSVWVFAIGAVLKKVGCWLFTSKPAELSVLGGSVLGMLKDKNVSWDLLGGHYDAYAVEFGNVMVRLRSDNGFDIRLNGKSILTELSRKETKLIKAEAWKKRDELAAEEKAYNYTQLCNEANVNLLLKSLPAEVSDTSEPDEEEELETLEDKLELLTAHATDILDSHELLEDKVQRIHAYAAGLQESLNKINSFMSSASARQEHIESYGADIRGILVALANANERAVSDVLTRLTVLEQTADERHSVYEQRYQAAVNPPDKRLAYETAQTRQLNEDCPSDIFGDHVYREHKTTAVDVDANTLAKNAMKHIGPSSAAAQMMKQYVAQQNGKKCS